METAENSTPTTEVQTTDTSSEITPVENTDTVTDEPVEQQDVAEQEQPTDTQEPEKLYAGKYKTVEELEKGYKETEKSFNRVAELEKEIETLRSQVPKQPQIVNEQGKVNPQYEQQFYLNLNRGELQEYQNLALRIEDTDDRNEAINILNQANMYFANGNMQAFNKAMNEAKMYFNPAYIEQVNSLKMQALANKDNTINQAIQEQKKQALNTLETELRQNQEVWELVDPQSPNYSEDVFGVVKEYFDSFGGVDTNRLASFIKAIEANGVRKYTANLEAQKTAEMNKQKASITGGDNVNIQTDMPSYAQIEKMSQEEYNKAYAKWGDKLLTAK